MKLEFKPRRLMSNGELWPDHWVSSVEYYNIVCFRHGALGKSVAPYFRAYAGWDRNRKLGKSSPDLEGAIAVCQAYEDQHHARRKS